MQKQVPQNAVLVKKHNKTEGKKWLLNMDLQQLHKVDTKNDY